MDRDSSTSSSLVNKKWHQRLGPGLITACVVIGPGSILTSSEVGAAHGYAMSWVVMVAVFFMMIYTMLGAKLGVVTGRSNGDLIAGRIGRPVAILIGAAVFFISAAFQFGNNLGIHSALNHYLDFDESIIVFNVLAIAFLFAFRNLYRALERLMMVLVGLMLLSFAVNLCYARPAIGELLLGFVPGKQAEIDLSMLGLVGTTFVITASYFQSYLVRQKGWGKAELRDGLIDARVGALLMAVITLMIMTTAATVLRGKNLESPDDIAQQLVPLFGESGRVVFCLGLFSAGFSSFLINSMIGGFILSDGLGFGNRPDQLGPKILTTVVLLTGMSVALYIIKTGWEPLPAIVAAQAVTVPAAPIVAAALLWMTSRADIMGEDKNSPLTNVVAGVGLVLLIAMAIYTATVTIPAKIEKMQSSLSTIRTVVSVSPGIASLHV